MNKDNHLIENNLNNEGYNLIAGVDEVGRGCLAGPVVASAVILPKGTYIDGVKDSKKLSDKERRLLKTKIEKLALAHATIFIDEGTIDKINILESSKLAMVKAIESLNPKPDFVLVDALKLAITIPSLGIVKGDDLSFSIACASIIAKVNRDDYMIELSKEYPEYGFQNHKGYPTKKHLEALSIYGILPIHRKSYEPVRRLLKVS